MSIYKFTETDYNLDKNDKIFNLYTKLSKGKKLDNIDLEFIHNYFSFNNGVCKLMGWIIDFTEFFNHYYVETKHYGVKKICAINKTYARKLCTNYGGINSIQQVI